MSIILIFFMDSPELTLGIRAPATPAGNSLDGCPRQVLGITESVMPDECGMNYQISPENPRDSEEYTLIEAALETVWRNRDRLGPPRSSVHDTLSSHRVVTRIFMIPGPHLNTGGGVVMMAQFTVELVQG